MTNGKVKFPFLTYELFTSWVFPKNGDTPKSSICS